MLTHKGTATIKTERLILRKYKLSDANDIFENYANDNRVTKFLSWQPYENINQLEDFISSRVDIYSDDVYDWVIEFENHVIGSISAIRDDGQNENCEIGYCIGYDYQKKGIASEALTAVLNYLFTEVGYHRIFAKHDIENSASGKVMQKCDMIYEGKLREYYLRHDGTRSDSLIYAILKSDFEKLEKI